MLIRPDAIPSEKLLAKLGSSDTYTDKDGQGSQLSAIVSIGQSRSVSGITELVDLSICPALLKKITGV